MEFDKSKVYTALNASELEIGSKVIVADSLGELRIRVLNDEEPGTLLGILDEYNPYRFNVSAKDHAPLAYLVEKPVKLKWTELKVGDVIRKGTQESMILAIDRAKNTGCHILICMYNNFSTDLSWLGDEQLAEWEKIENDR